MDTAERLAGLAAVRRDEILRMYREVADRPGGD